MEGQYLRLYDMRFSPSSHPIELKQPCCRALQEEVSCSENVRLVLVLGGICRHSNLTWYTQVLSIPSSSKWTLGCVRDSITSPSDWTRVTRKGSPFPALKRPGPNQLSFPFLFCLGFLLGPGMWACVCRASSHRAEKAALEPCS